MKFDIIIGNPPYQDGTKSTKTKAGGGKKNLYAKFAYKSIELLSDNGILSFLTPPGLFKTTNEYPSEFLLYLQKHNKLINLVDMDASLHFKVGTPICSWLVSNLETKLLVKSQGNTIKFDYDINYIPYICNNMSISIITKMLSTPGNSLNIKRDIQPNTFKEGISFGTLLSGNKKIKVYTDNSILSKSGCLSIETSNIYNYKLFMESKTMKVWFIIHSYNSTLYRKFLNRIKIPFDMTTINSEDDIYKFYKFSNNEINYIETKM